MRAPRPVGTPIDATRRNVWRRQFGSYCHGVTEAGILDWLNQFKDTDRDTAARLLDAVEFISAEQIREVFRALLNRLPGWHQDEARRIGRFAFVAFSSSAGESGDRMLHDFRLATQMANRRFNPLFIGRSEIPAQRFGADDTVVFLDDFVGTGNQVVNAWNGMFQELTAGVGNVYLMTVAASRIGQLRIQNETDIVFMPHHLLMNSDNFFHDACKHFSIQEKNRMLTYCRRASRKYPRGWGDCGLVVVLYHRSPNNSLAVLHATSKDWVPLFPRN